MLVRKISGVGALQKLLAHVWWPKGGSVATPLVIGVRKLLLGPLLGPQVLPFPELWSL